MFEWWKERDCALGFKEGYFDFKPSGDSAAYLDGYEQGVKAHTMLTESQTSDFAKLVLIDDWVKTNQELHEEIVLLEGKLVSAKEILATMRKTADTREAKMQEVLTAIRAIPYVNRRRKHA